VEQFEAHLVRRRRCPLGKSNREYPSHSWPHEPKILLEQFQKLLSSEGLTLEDVIGTKRRGKPRKRGVLRVKYRDPETGKGWSGRGRKPVWLVDKLQKGLKLEDFAVESPPAENPDEPEEEEVSPAA
jgi:DNA-binding protein H-NS